jgi:hypothetical protein
MDLTASILISLVALATGLGPMRADFNATHATNPLWTPHARFHVVWQVLCQSGISLFILYLVWIADFPGHVLTAAILNFNWAVSFFITLLNMKRFEGSLKDVNGIRPFRFRIGGREHLVDTNLFGACLLSILTGIATLLLLT